MPFSRSPIAALTATDPLPPRGSTPLAAIDCEDGYATTDWALAVAEAEPESATTPPTSAARSTALRRRERAQGACKRSRDSSGETGQAP
jgi:hypothetical protein